MAISFSFVAVAFITPFFAPNAHEAAAGLAYPLGFIFVVTANYQLFTENTLEPVVPVLTAANRGMALAPPQKKAIERDDLRGLVIAI
jgi:formate/nitrite transporter FocA (FNT family)